MTEPNPPGLRAKLTWIFLFAIIVGLSPNSWWWDGRVEPDFLGLPTWFYYFGIVQIVLCLAIYALVRSRRDSHS